MRQSATSTAPTSQSAAHECQSSKQRQQQQQLGVIHLNAVAAAAPLPAPLQVPAPGGCCQQCCRQAHPAWHWGLTVIQLMINSKSSCLAVHPVSNPSLCSPHAAHAGAALLGPSTHHPVPPAGASVSIVSSLELSLHLVERLERELVAERHRFVCLLLATMAREQLAAVAAAAAAGEQPALAAAARVHFAVAEAGGQIVAGAVFYPRSDSLKQAGSAGPSLVGPAEGSGASSASGAPCAGGQQCGDGSGMDEVGSLQLGLSPAAAAQTAAAVPGASSAVAAAVAMGAGEGATTQPTGVDGGDNAAGGTTCSAVDPHLYIELLVTNQPGRGWGSLLLQHIEQHARHHAGQGGQLAAEGGQALKAIKLLSVAAAQDFYSRHSYSQPDKQKEMSKLLRG